MFFELWSVVGPRETLGTRRKASAVVTPRRDYGETSRAQGDLDHLASASLGQDASLSFVARGQGIRRRHAKA